MVEKVGSNLISYDPKDPEGTQKVLFNADAQKGSGGGSTTSGQSTTRDTEPDPNQYISMTGNELLVELKKQFNPDFANKIASELTNEQLKLFLNDHEVTRQSGNYAGFETDYYQEWKVAAGIEEPEDDTGAETTEGINNRFR